MFTLVISRLIQMGLIFAGIKIATTLMPPAEMAKVYLIASLFALAALVLINPAGVFISRRLIEWNQSGKIRGHLRRFWFYSLAAGLFVFLMVLALHAAQLLAFSSGFVLAALVAGTLVSTTLNQTVIPGLNLLGYRSWFSILGTLTTLATLLISVGMVTYFAPNAESWQIGIIGGNIIVALWGCKILYSKVSRPTAINKITPSEIKGTALFAIPVAATVSLAWIQNQSYRFIMESSIGLHELGLFATGLGISIALMGAFEATLNAYFYPSFYERISSNHIDEQANAWNDLAQAIIPSCVLVGAFILVTGPEIARTVLGPEFLYAQAYVAWGVFSELGRIGASIYALVAHARMNTRILLVPAITGAALSVALITWWMPLHGTHGAGAALMVASVIAFVVTGQICKRHLRIRFPTRTLFFALAMALCLFALSSLLRWVEKDMGSHAALIHIGLIGLVFLGFQFMLIRPQLKLQ
jgi:O-antigen/teichoic acid export membrane protein